MLQGRYQYPSRNEVIILQQGYELFNLNGSKFHARHLLSTGIITQAKMKINNIQQKQGGRGMKRDGGFDIWVIIFYLFGSLTGRAIIYIIDVLRTL
jgi:hypothetical protein